MSRRTLLTILTLAGLAITGGLLYRQGYLTQDQLQATLLSMGCWATPAYLGLFILGLLINIPAIVFILAAPAVFGGAYGVAVGYAGGLMSGSIAFCLARRMRGEVTSAPPKSRLIARVMQHATRRPVWSIALLRALMGLSPPVNYALAFSPIRARDHIAGTALGLIPFVLVVTQLILHL